MTLRMRVLPRFPAKITATNGLTVERPTGTPNLIIKPDFGSLVQIPSVGDADNVFFIAWDKLAGLYRIMSFTDLFNGVAEFGFMDESVYDPQGKHADAFARANHTGVQAISTITNLQASLDAKADSSSLASYLLKAGGLMTGDIDMGGHFLLNAGDAGKIDWFATKNAPTGWLKANGAAVSRSTYSALFAALVTSAGYTAQTFTVTIAAPAVVTRASHGFVGGERLRLSTTGALPTGLNTSTDYFVIFVDANTFRLASSAANAIAGTAITTTGSQSGTHSYLRSDWGLGDGSTTFNIPDLRGEFIRGLDDGRGVDTNRILGGWQNDDNKSHNHGIVSVGSSGGGTGVFVSSTGAPLGTITSYIASSGGGEAHPRSIAFLPCVKY